MSEDRKPGARVSVKVKRPRMRVRLLLGASTLNDDGETCVYVPQGMTGTVLNVKNGLLCVCWDGAFVCDLHQKHAVDDRAGVLLDWEDPGVAPDSVVFVVFELPT